MWNYRFIVIWRSWYFTFAFGFAISLIGCALFSRIGDPEISFGAAMAFPFLVQCTIGLSGEPRKSVRFVGGLGASLGLFSGIEIFAEEFGTQYPPSTSFDSPWGLLVMVTLILVIANILAETGGGIGQFRVWLALKLEQWSASRHCHRPRMWLTHQTHYWVDSNCSKYGFLAGFVSIAVWELIYCGLFATEWPETSAARGFCIVAILSQLLITPISMILHCRSIRSVASVVVYAGWVPVGGAAALVFLGYRRLLGQFSVSLPTVLQMSIAAAGVGAVLTIVTWLIVSRFRWRARAETHIAYPGEVQCRVCGTRSKSDSSPRCTRCRTEFSQMQWDFVTPIRTCGLCGPYYFADYEEAIKEFDYDEFVYGIRNES